MALIIGLIYDHDENWIAGSYYIENLIHALVATSKEKPVLKIYSKTKENFEVLKARTNYPKLRWVELKDRNTFIDRIVNKISYIFFNRHWIIRGMDSNVDVLFPGSDTFLFDKIRRKLFWIPDFQEQHYPNFFNAHELNRRKSFYNKLVRQGWPIVFSSLSAHLDFKNLCPKANNKIFVLPFAVTLPSLAGIQIQSLKEKYKIETDYFICSNQFWAHKNHLLILRAILELKQIGVAVLVVFTGKPYDPRNPEYYQNLMSFVNENEIESNIRFTGFIDRKEQLVLMKNSIAVIQPSLFEGWSTVIEDAKALNVTVLASDIPVHHEQLEDRNVYFDKTDTEELKSKMKNLIISRSQNNFYYDTDVKVFGENFLKIATEIITG